MNNFQDLNAWGNTAITFANAAAYSLAFSNSGNVSITKNEEEAFTLPKQINVTTLSDAPQDLLVTMVAGNSQAVFNIGYTGTFSNIGIAQISNTTWQMQGIRSIARYNELFANSSCQLNTDHPDDFNITVSLNDQQGNTASYIISIDVVPQDEYSLPADIVYDEGLFANITGMQITDQDPVDSDYTVTIAVDNPDQGLIGYQGSSVPELQLTGNRDVLNEIFANAAPRWEPQGDFSFNDTIYYTQIRNSDGSVQANAVPIIMQIGNTHAEYSIPTSINFLEDIVANIANVSITDVRWDDPTYTVTVASANISHGQIQFGNTIAANAVLVGNKTAVNSIFSANSVKWIPAVDYAANATITYTQVRNSDGEVHANAVPITMVVTPSPEVAITLDYWTEPNVVTDLEIEIVDAAVNKNYSSNIFVNGGNLLASSVNIGNTVSYTGNLSAVNAQLANLQYVRSAYGDVTWTYLQTQTTDAIVQSNETGNFKTPRILGQTDITLGEFQQRDLLTVTAGNTLSSGEGFYLGSITDLGPSADSIVFVEGQGPSNSTIARVDDYSIDLYAESAESPYRKGLLINKFDPTSYGLGSGSAATLEFWIRCLTLGTVFFNGGIDTRLSGLDRGLFPNIGVSNYADTGELYWIFQYEYLPLHAGYSGVYGYTGPYARSTAETDIGEWQHIAVTTDTDRRVRIWVDGQEVVYLQSGAQTSFPEVPGRIVTDWYASDTGLSGGTSVQGNNNYWMWGASQGQGARVDDGNIVFPTEFRKGARFYLDNVRVSNTKRYTADFTPPDTTQSSQDGNTIVVMRGLTDGI